MGRIQGFLGGVLLTSTLTYLTALEINSNKTAVSNALRNSAKIIDDRDKEVSFKENVIEINSRPSILETSKDIWNNEVIKATNFLYSLSWYGFGQSISNEVKKIVRNE
ncbi:hypothetical protein PACTADRAFT_49551 [Pachysolen tannophilus NRRL Y-2460]|uniref:MICOS complex subunit MIC12 n=1 Tax=Pachysolen tannophilus NRRL Y-2460 TaxID=669874 RepID=A0A1E4TWM4_PACTA|nr:hypothetical protein PACTADRAFT_49551 [Pachysolen tannophilus NRRL Y-2460]